MDGSVAHLAARVVMPLGVLAVVVVLVCSAIVLRERSDDPARVGAADPPEAWQVVATTYAEVRVPPPSQGWSVLDPDGVLFYADRRGEPAVGVRGPAVLDDGYCSASAGAGPSHRAFVGLVPPHPAADLRVAAAATSARWVSGIAGELRSTRRTTTRLADGAPAVSSRSTIRLHDRDPCTPTRVGLHVVSTRSRAGVVSAVLVRDLGPGAASEATVARILTSLRVRRPQSLRSRT